MDGNVEQSHSKLSKKKSSFPYKDKDPLEKKNIGNMNVKRCGNKDVYNEIDIGSSPVVKKLRYEEEEGKKDSPTVCSDCSCEHDRLIQKVLALEERCNILDIENSKLHDLLMAKGNECKKLLVELAIKETSISVLPINCLLMIFEYVNNVRMIVQVCSKWEKVLNSHRKSFVKSSSYNIDQGGICPRYGCGLYLNSSICNYNCLYSRPKFGMSEPTKWYEDNWTYKPIEMIITNQSTGTSIVGMMKLAIAECPDWWIQDVKELQLNMCRLSDNWLWLIERLPNLEKLIISMPRCKKSIDRELRIPSSMLISTLGNCIKTVKLNDFHYAKNETEIMTRLIEKSHLSPTGLKNISIELATGRDRNRARFWAEPLPIRELIKLIEKANFDRSVEISIEHAGIQQGEFIDWMKSKNIVPKEESRYSNDSWRRYLFNYRESHFDVSIVNRAIPFSRNLI